MGPSGWRRRTIAGAAALALALALAAGCSGDDGDDRARVVVTTPVLGAVVADLAGDAADVRVLMPNGADPHEYQPSARDVEALSRADLVVEVGLGLEQGLEDAIDQAAGDGVPVFTAAEHVALRRPGGEEGEADPHIWMDPLAVRDVARALTPALRETTGADLDGRPARVEAGLTRLDRQIAAQVETIPPPRRKLVTGHESMGYFADRYGFEVIGALIPSLSSQAQPSAESLAGLRRQVQRAGVPAVFTEAGTPRGLAEAIADETGARVVEVATEALPEDGSYATFMERVADAVVGGLASPEA